MMQTKLQLIPINNIDEEFHIDVSCPISNFRPIKKESRLIDIILSSNDVEYVSHTFSSGWAWYVFKIKKEGEHGISIIYPNGHDHYVVVCQEKKMIQY